MDDSIIELGFLWFFGALVLGPLLGWLVNRKWGFERGIAVGCLLIGLTGSVVAVWGGWDRWQQLRGSLEVSGRLVDRVEERSKDADGKVTVSEAPRVAYVAADGKEYVIKGLGGSQADKAPGDAVALRYWPEAPERAVIADFQNVWGVILALAIFGGFPLLFGLFFLAFDAASRGGAIRPPTVLTPGQQRRQAWAGYLVVVGNLTVLGAFGFMMFAPGDELASAGGGFCGIALACLIYMLAESLSPLRDWQRLAILFIVGAGFGVFGVGSLLMGQGV